MTGGRYRLGVDIGGTFTDVVLLGDDGALRRKKVLSTPDDYARGVVDGAVALLAESNVEPGLVDTVVHATTVASNAVLEGKGAKTALITTQGFRDVLEMRRLRIPVLYDLQYVKPAPLVPRRRRFEVPERMGPKGDVRVALDEEAVKRVAGALADDGVEALAISMLHAYANPEHELRAAEIVRETVGDGLFITCSSDVLPEIREYERTSTAVVNAYLGPTVRGYLSSLLDALRGAGLTAPLQIMQSSGGIMSPEAAIERPALLLESGPAAGVVACAHLASQVAEDNMITLDMGGTTAKAALLENRRPVKTTEYEVGAGINLSSKLIKGGGYAIRLPFIDISEIGAGGGSLVSVDEFGITTVGPESAGADPGPVCYDLGGESPTLTDTFVSLGYVKPESIAGGAVKLNAAKAREALQEQVADPLGKPLLEAAYGVYELAIATMTRAVKAVTTYRGRDPRDFTLACFGGNGAVTGAAIARVLNIPRVLVPPAPGVFSAAGLLVSDIEHEFTRTPFLRGDAISAAALERDYDALEEQARVALVDEGFRAETITLSRSAEMRYSGQAYELSVAVKDDDIDVARMIADFNAEHERTYGHASDSDPVDVVSVKVLGRVEAARASALLTSDQGGRASGTRAAYFGEEHGVLETPVIGRGDLAGTTREGPLLIDEYDATCVVPPGCRASLDALGNIVIDVERSA
ncbi:MAG: N-methylhydantoinase [Thermoleophilaceae bacterium]|nr:N-methylhydantoinase [Thermoleophilaceae bacterium]